MAILDVRGTSGSGKSWIVRKVLATYDNDPIISNDAKIIGYHVPPINLIVLGKYTNTGGGCDGFKGGAVEVDNRVRELASNFTSINLLLEGLMVSHLFKRFHGLATDLPDYKFLFMDTPLDKCIWRVRQRRLAKGNEKPFDPAKNLIPEYNRIMQSVKPKLIEAGHCVITLNHRNPLPVVLKELTNVVG